MFSQWSDNNPNYSLHNTNQYNPIHYYNILYSQQCILNHITTILKKNKSDTRPNKPIQILTTILSI